MVLFAVTGSLGAGKTLSMTFLLWHNWFSKRRKVYSNLHLFKIPYYLIDSIDKLELMEKGIVGMDELWFWVDAYTSRSKVNRLASNVLLKSRKKELTMLFTTQTLGQLTTRVRNVIDFTAYPMLNPNETLCKLLIFRGTKGNAGSFMREILFRTELVFKMYDTREIVDMKEESDKEIKIVFQPNYNKEHGYLCTCEECGTKFFKTWEEADKYAEQYWINEIYKKYGYIPI